MSDARLHFRTPLLRTPFHERTSAANVLNSWAPWAGYTTALVFNDESMEYTAIRNQVTVYDLTPMRKYSVRGPDAAAFLNRLAIRNAAKLKVGHVHYTAWCDEHGKLMDDGTLFRFAEDDYRLCCQELHLPWLLDSAAGYNVEIREVTDEIAPLSLQGPCAWAVLRAAGFTEAGKLKPFQMGEFSFGSGGTLTISRTGFTGDLGYELWTTPDRALELWDLLFEAGALYGIRPIGTTALNMARIEAGFVITNLDFVAAEQAVRDDRARSPFEMGLDWMIDFDKGHFNGRRALLDEKTRKTSKWALVGLDVEGNVSPENSIVYSGKTREVGLVTAGIWSPTLKRSIALAMVERPYHAENSNDLWIEIYALRELAYHKLMVRARVTERPFFNPARRRATPPGDF
ncbi:MAG: aminomethyltransferase family protein [Hyphomicrobium sp.]|uniref:aminomethyltransferase family protein n=1 Tax=Hyphomicrobium sp. TaxID=82 RepID=UPI003D0EB58B